ncbi:YoaH family protein [Acerihabitans sp. TG2]|uniref:YoaH family protein n=1 Tax=Acerihabitans sp. TG2 TaxID=3096008 RepID=UPI002B23BB6A|nr:YoaH family protein [Acerihabitans sp. TG2]MEA9389497.1 YoaH family protein [Acerihabitans sp. TG2]
MLTDMPALNHQQQQEAVERIQALMSEGMSSGEAIRLVSSEIRANHTGERVSIRWDDDDDDDDEDEDQERDRPDAAGQDDEVFDDDDEEGAI